MTEETVMNYLVIGLLISMNIGVVIAGILFSED